MEAEEGSRTLAAELAQLESVTARRRALAERRVPVLLAQLRQLPDRNREPIAEERHRELLPVPPPCQLLETRQELAFESRRPGRLVEDQAARPRVRLVLLEGAAEVLALPRQAVQVSSRRLNRSSARRS